ncbi:hypothetical protein [Nocardia jinanensis]|uniref:Uncharacterized protein n=1 Tax=Nocardia jinanensis TaxID=382504 RepID=A0A917RZ80_9NOCA|nr:hypothetical protein [Nocardia jinanensis]GGL44027.1 hypothetical protein GCM10011588_68480 [Nocardia jinanensis]
MTTTSPHYTPTEPRYYVSAPIAPNLCDRIVREEHADIALAVTFALEAVYARNLGHHRRARRMAAVADRSARTCRPELLTVELSALRAVLAGEPITVAPIWGDTPEILVARAHCRLLWLREQLLSPAPAVTEWYLRAARAWHGRLLGARRLRQYLLSYGIDPTKAAALAALDEQRHDGLYGPILSAQGYYNYVGVTEARTGLYMRTEATTSVAELVPTHPLRPSETDTLAHAWLDLSEWEDPRPARLIAVLDRWIARARDEVRS